MKKYIKLFIIPISFLLANCTNGQNSAVDSHPGSGTVKSDSTANAAGAVPNQNTMKADTPITNGQKSNPGNRH